MPAEYIEIDLPYGHDVIKVRVPKENIAAILSPRHAKALKDERSAIERSLKSSIACPPLASLVKGGDRVVVIVTDNTRACPDDRLLPPILAELEQKVQRENITIIVALGLHKPMSQAELVKKLGEDILANYRVLNHDVNDTVNVGVTTRGTPVEINRRVVEADFRISTGFIEPHFFAGFSGGRKSIAPGVFSVRAAYKNHGYEMIKHPYSRAGILKGNPVHEDMVEQAVMAKLNFIVNVILDKDRAITHVVAGHPVKAHEAGCAFVSDIATVKIRQKVDIAICTNSGAPLDLDLYQTCKGIYTASSITRHGGVIIMASSCHEGMGPASFEELHASVTCPEEVLGKIKNEEPLGVQWENQVLAMSHLGKEIYLLSNLEDSAVRRMMMTPIHSIEEGLDRAFRKLGADARIGVIPEGPLVIPLVERYSQAE